MLGECTEALSAVLTVPVELAAALRDRLPAGCPLQC